MRVGNGLFVKAKEPDACPARSGDFVYEITATGYTLEEDRCKITRVTADKPNDPNPRVIYVKLYCNDGADLENAVRIGQMRLERGKLRISWNQADELPRIYFGKWCGSSDNSLFKQRDSVYGEKNENCGQDNSQLILNRDGFAVGEQNCRFTSLRKTGQSLPRATKPAKGDWPKGDWVPEVDAFADCKDQTVKLRLHWLKGDQLAITNLLLPVEISSEMPSELRGSWCYADYNSSGHWMIYERRRCRQLMIDGAEQMNIGRSTIILSVPYTTSCMVSYVTFDREGNSWKAEFACPNLGLERYDLVLYQGRLFSRRSDR